MIFVFEVFQRFLFYYCIIGMRDFDLAISTS